MAENCILSIVIPTRNRLKYLRGCLRAIARTDLDGAEVIIQDNSENHEEVRRFVESLSSPCFYYYYDGRKLSQTENSDLAVSHATGKYVLYVGDDDAVCGTAVTLARAMDCFGVEACVFPAAIYNWPDLIAAVPGSFTLKYCGNISCTAIRVDTQELLARCLREGMQNITDLPRVYHGMVRRSLLNKIRERTGSFFPGPSPDMANAVSCALLAENCVKINVPIMIDGFGKSSAGGMGRRKLHRGSLKGNFQLRDDVEENWDPKIPKRWVQSAIYPASAVTALKALGEEKMSAELDYGVIAAETLLHDPAGFREIFACGLSPSAYGKMIFHMTKRTAQRFLVRRKPDPDRKILYDRIRIERAAELQNAENRGAGIQEAFDRLFSVSEADFT